MSVKMAYFFIFFEIYVQHIYFLIIFAVFSNSYLSKNIF